MNIEIANRLVELRKKSGLSQEQLADKLGLSRQAVSKWERAEASPDTDNLICLAKLYGVSLDDLLNTDQSIDDIAAQVKDKEEEEEKKSKDKDRVEFSGSGIHVHSSDGDDVTIGFKGVHINTADSKELKDKMVPSEEERKRRHRLSVISGACTGATAFIVTGLYIVLGCLYPAQVWHIGWIGFFLIPSVAIVFDFLKYKKLGVFTGLMVFLSVAAYMVMGMEFGLWHPGWVVFFAIPLWGILAGPIDDATRGWRHRNYVKASDVITIKTDEDDDDDDDDDDDED